MVEPVTPIVSLRAGPSGTTGAGLVLLLVVVVAIAAATRLGAGAPEYTVDMQVTTTRMSPADVTQIVTSRLGEMTLMTSQSSSAGDSKVLSMTAAPMSQLAALEAGAGKPVPGSKDEHSTVWVVRAEGVFVGQRVPPGAKPVVATTGYFVIDDATGDIIGMGMP